LALWLSLFISPLEITTIAHAADLRATTGEWGTVINWQIFGKHMVLLPNGKVLAWPTGQDAFLWDPVTQTKTAVPATFGDLHCAAQTLLPDGRVIVAGGVIVSPHDGITVTAIFDPVTNLWTNATPMHYPRWYGTTTTLPDGRILATSGDMPGGGRANIPEVYDPATDTWTLMPASATKDLGLYPQMFVLPNGKLFKAGTSTSTYLLDMAAGTWANGPTNAFGSSGYAESSAMYAPGKIIRSGGGDPSIANAAIVDMTAANPQWKQLSPMAHPRRRHNMVILADGQVMAVGGTGSADDLSAAVYDGEIWNPTTEQWSLTAPMTNDRMYHSSAMLLPDGRVLTAGGEFNGRMNAQIFSPPYLFMGARPTITAAPSTVGYGADFSVGVSTDGSSITSVALIGLSAVTHAFNHNQRFVPLTFSQSGNTLTATAPLNGNYAPPGFYMLVVKDSKGVPSVAKFVRVDSVANLTPGTITGQVTDSATGDPIQGATVSYGGGATAVTTDIDGNYTLSNVSPGEVLLSVSKSGYATISQTQSVTGGATATLSFVLAPPGTITGKVTDSSTGDPIGAAVVTYAGGTVSTNSNGDYTIAGIASGSQTLVASADGYNSSSDQAVDVPANGTATANITLTPKPTYLAGEVRDSYTNATIADTTISAGGVTVTTDSFGRYQLFVPPGTYNVTASKTGYTTFVRTGAIVTFGTYTAIDFTLNPLNPTFEFAASADTYANQAAPGNNYGTATTFRVLNSAGGSQASYLRFNVSGLTRPVQSAKLRLYVTNSSDQGGAIYSVANTYLGTATPWTETGLTWSNAPAIGGTPLSSIGAVATNTWIEFDVTAALAGNGMYAFGLQTTSANDARYSSKEASSNQPELVIQQFAAPVLESFTPTSGKAGVEVTIGGMGFANVTGVTIGGVPASSFTVDSDTQIRVVVPAGATTGKVVITTGGGTTASVLDFDVTEDPVPPSIDAFSPASGPIGTEVTIKGAGLGATTAVTFNGVAASSFTIDSATQIRAIVPAGATNGPIGVNAPAGSSTSVNSFIVTSSTTVTPPPPFKHTYLPLATNGGTVVGKQSIYTIQSIDWSNDSGNWWYVCELEGR
jgi:hypothetical protein